MLDPNTIIMIHETTIKEEMQRKDTEHHLFYTERAPGRGPVAGFRAVTARMLISLGDRIAPATRPAIEPCAPASSLHRSKRRLTAG